MLDKSVFCKIVTKDQLDCLQINHPKFMAEICIQGAQLTQFTPTGEQAYLWLSPDAEYQKGQGLRGGIPICWPWFGGLSMNPDQIKTQTKPTELAHGFVRTMDWSIREYRESAHEINIVMGISHSEASLAIWPFEFDLSCHFKLSNTLNVELKTTNLSSSNMYFSQALHSYFPTSDIHNTKILGAEKQNYVDALDLWKTKQQVESIAIKKEVDRIYFGKSDYRILTPEHATCVKSNSLSSVIWNPWINKSKRLSQFSDNAYQSMLCIESANALEDAVSLPSLKSHTLKLNISR